MPQPYTYRHATEEYRAFLAIARDLMGLESDNMTYTAVQGVLQVFRRRLTPSQGIAFADALPSVLRAIFVEGWDVEAPPLPFSPRLALVREVKAFRPNHNLTPDNAIDATAEALWRSVRGPELARALRAISPEAEEFWQAESAFVLPHGAGPQQT